MGRLVFPRILLLASKRRTNHLVESELFVSIVHFQVLTEKICTAKIFREEEPQRSKVADCALRNRRSVKFVATK